LLKKNLFRIFNEISDEKEIDAMKNPDKNINYIYISKESLQLTYDNFSYTDVIRKILRKDSAQIPNSYEIIGKIAHLNLREVFLEYKFLIGQIILDVI